MVPISVTLFGKEEGMFRHVSFPLGISPGSFYNIISCIHSAATEEEAKNRGMAGSVPHLFICIDPGSRELVYLDIPVVSPTGSKSMTKRKLVANFCEELPCKFEVTITRVRDNRQVKLYAPKLFNDIRNLPQVTKRTLHQVEGRSERYTALVNSTWRLYEPTPTVVEAAKLEF